MNQNTGIIGNVLKLPAIRGFVARNHDDLWQVGLLVLVRCARGYDPAHFSQAKFASYAGRAVRNEIRTYIARRILSQGITAHHNWTDDWSKAPTMISLNQDRGAGQSKTSGKLGEFIESLVVKEEEENEVDGEAIKRLLRKLTGREQYVIRRRFWDGVTLRELAVEFGISKERVRQIELVSLRKMRNKLDPISMT